MNIRLASVAAALLAGTAYGSAQEVAYTVSIPRPTTRLVDVTLHVRDAPGETIDVAMPIWTPGGYEPLWHGKNVQELHAVDAQGNPLDTRCVGTSRWRVLSNPGDVRVMYRVYVPPSRGGYSRLDDEHFRLTSVGTLMYVVGDEPYPAPGPLTLKINAPDGWVMATGLEATGPGEFAAPDYDTLVDAPVEVARELDVRTFEDHGARYEVAIRNPHNYGDAFLEEIRAIVAEQAEMMGGVPFDRYVFVMTGTNTRGGGLEHLNSTTISFKRYDETTSSDYHRLQFLIAHEFFHLWNVKRIRPEILGPFDYSKPQHSKNIYVSEGITDYISYLTVARAGLWTRAEFYAELAKVIETLQSKPGRLITSAEEASWRAWTRHDNPAHTEISFYTKGSLIGLLLDLDIRARTEDRRSLDDVFRLLLEEHGLPKPGFDEERGFQDAVERITREGGGDPDFTAFFDAYVSGVEELDYNAYLRHVGLRLEIDEQEERFEPSLELELDLDGDLPVVTGLTFDGAAYRAGIMTGDVLLMLAGERVVATTLPTRLRMIGVGGAAELQVLRGDRLVPVTVRLGEERPVTYRIVEDEGATPAHESSRNAWLQPHAR